MNKKIALLMVVGIFTFLLPVYSQSPKTHKKTYHQANDGKLYWNRFLPFYLSISPSPNKKGVKLESKITKQYANPAYFDTEGINYIRTKNAVDTTTNEIVYPQIEIKWEVYADGIAPVSQHDYSGANTYSNKSSKYFGKDLKFSLHSTDETSGVKQTYVSINKDSFSPYNDTIDLDTEGDYTLRYYAVDNVGNVNDVFHESIVVDKTEPTSNLIIKENFEDIIYGKDTKISLENSDNLSGVKVIYYRIDNNEYKTISVGKVIPKNYLDDGEHSISYYSVDRVGNIEEAKKKNFYFDKLPPLLASDILGDRYYANEKVYFSGRTKLMLTSVDNKSGVKNTYYALNNTDFKVYKNPFYLPSISGEHIVRYYSVDNMGNSTRDNSQKQTNKEYKYNISKIYVDLTGPSMDYKYNGPVFIKRSKTYISPETQVTLLAKDAESGLKKISYSLDKETKERDFDSSFTLTENGKHHVEIFAYDNVNNRNKKDFSVMVDGDAPEISYTFSVPPFEKKEDGTDIYPKYVDLFLAATDNIVGNDIIKVSVNGSDYKEYDAPISNFKEHAVNTLKIIAIDKLQNKSEKTIRFSIE